MPNAGDRRLLLLLRHAKSAWPDVEDHLRPLAPRGRKNAPLVGKWLRAHGYLPGLVLCSTALRAMQTWELVAGELDKPAQATPEDRIYGASCAALLELLRQTPSSVNTVMLVGHDPGVPDLARTLSDDTTGTAGKEPGRIPAKFPTGAVAVLRVSRAWRDLDAGGAQLLDFVAPRDLEH
jgi:phosphohistidine phosphatase